MEPSEIDALVQRLVANPHDEDALAYAHEAGASDPKSYAFLLEKVGTETRDPAYASHWLSEAANVWSTTLGDAHRAARVLMMAIDKDPTQQVAAERLAQLYRDKGDVKALVALLDRRAKALGSMAAQNPQIRGEVAGMYEELGRLWTDAPLAQPKKAAEAFRRAIELDPQAAYAIYSLREIDKSLGQWDEALGLYAAELAIETDPARRLAILRDEAVSRKLAGDLPGATRALGNARQIDDGDPALQQEYAASVLDRIQGGENVSPSERGHAAELLVGLAEVYDGEHGLAYAAGALDIEPGHDRALQLYIYYARNLQREDELSSRYLGYVQSAPNGSMAAEVRHTLAASFEASGDYRNAVQLLEPLRDAGDNEATAKLKELYPLAAQQGPGPDLVSLGSGRPQAMGAAQADSERPQAIQKRAPQVPADKVQGVLDAAQMLAGKGKKPEALVKYKEVLDAEPAHPEALAWVEDYLRTKRDYGQLRDVLLSSVRAMGSFSDASIGGRKERLREVAGLCEGNLRDIDGAIAAWKQLLSLDRADEGARQSLTRLLDKSQRWDDLASLLEQEATSESDIETKIGLEKKLAALQETKRKDPGAAAEAWARIARLAPDDAQAVGTASKLFEKADKLDMAAQVIADGAAAVDDPVARGNLFERLGELREQLTDLPGAGEAYADAAEALKSQRLWESAERCFVAAEKWERAANAAGQRGQLSGETKTQASHFARAADLLNKSGDHEAALARLEQATDLDPIEDEYATALADRYMAGEKWEQLVAFLSKRGDRMTDRAKRIAIRTQAATLYTNKVGDKEQAREQWLKVLEDGDDREALEKLIDYAVEREDHTEAATLLRRLGGIAVDKADKARIALREAELLAEGVGDIDTAIARYESILADLDSTCRPALQAIADLQETRDNLGDAADALERELRLVADPQERGQIAARLARLYESLDDPRNAIRALDIVRKADLEDFDALTRLCELCEKTEQWDRVAELLTLRIEVEGDESEASQMTKKLADILADKLDRGDEALAALTELADQGDAHIRQAYVDLGDRLGWKGIVASKLVEWWFEAKHGAERTGSLRGAFNRFVEVGREQDAARVAIEIVRSKGADRELAESLEVLGVKTNDHDALSIAHDLLSRELNGEGRAHELVRQAEVRVRAGMPRTEAIQHGEAGLTSVSPADAESLLDRLAALAAKPYEVVDLYERQVSRSKAPADRIRALSRAAQVAASKGALDRARGFFELALTGSPSDETLALLETTARDGDRTTGGEKLRRALCTAMAAGGQGARDGGRTRGALLRRAASMMNRDLNDVEQAFAWLGDALVAHVDSLTLDALEGLGIEVSDPRRSEGALTHALSEVFDGPLVRQLLARRAKIRREQMDDKGGAATDLKKLHDLSPNDHAVMEELSNLLTELGDYRGMVQLYEDQILRGKDMNARADLARKVARMWEEQLKDPREAADAWRRVLRMKQADPEATAGLERAKTNMLKKPDPGASGQYAPPKLLAESAPPIKGSEPPPGSKPSSTLETAAPNVANALPGLEDLLIDPSHREEAAPRHLQPEAAEDEDDTGSDTAVHAVLDMRAAPLALPIAKPVSEPPPPVPEEHAEPAAEAHGEAGIDDLLALGDKEDPTEEKIEVKPERPKDLWFRSSQDEITMSAHTESPLEASNTSSDSLASRGFTPPLREASKTGDAPPGYNASFAGGADATSQGNAIDDDQPDLGQTGEIGTYDFMDATVARSQEPDERAALASSHGAPSFDEDDEEVLIADDLADIVEVDDDLDALDLQDHAHHDRVPSETTATAVEPTASPSERPSQKPRTTPPPLPRS